MAASKRGMGDTKTVQSKKVKLDPSTRARPAVKNARKPRLPSSQSSDASFSDADDDEGDDSNNSSGGVPITKSQFSSESTSKSAPSKSAKPSDASRESHAKQKVLAQERKAAKPHADSIARTKKIWERLRLKSHVPPSERKTLVAELFNLISGRITDFVFKHDSVRVVQCALKYANQAQRRQIADELKGSYRALAESKYAKFLLAKIVVGDKEVRDAVIPEFYGHVKRLIRHPEAAWIVDDIYRGVATAEQKARMLREWYGHEFALFQPQGPVTMELKEILRDEPEKKGPIMQHLKEMTNQLVQKKTTGFTMLHDALLQYFLSCTPGSPEAQEVLELMKGDEEGDLLKNLAFTKSGSRLVCLGLAWSGAKDRRAILKVYKGVIKMLAADVYGHVVLLAAMDVIDDTVMTAKAIFPEMLGKDLDDAQRDDELLGQIQHPIARVPLVYLLTSTLPRWLSEPDQLLLREVHEIRQTTSRKDAETRRVELLQVSSPTLLGLIQTQPSALLSSALSAQYIVEVMFGAVGDRSAALGSLAAAVRDEPEIIYKPCATRALKSLVQGGPWNADTQRIEAVDPPLGFAALIADQCRDRIPEWAKGSTSFVVLALLESKDMEGRGELVDALRREKEGIQMASREGNKGAQLILDMLEA